MGTRLCVLLRLGLHFADSDFNFSRSVESDDLAIWEAGFSSAGTSHAEDDADGDGDVDGLDFLKWQQQFTGTAFLAASTGVPEPTTLVMTLMALTVIHGRLRTLLSRRYWGLDHL